MRRSVVVLSFFVSSLSALSQECLPDGFEGPSYFDTYHELYDKPAKWNVYNVHDPSVYKDGDWYYMYNTDVGMGYTSGSGAMKRRSQDLVNWEYLGHAFDGIPDTARNFFLQYNPDYTDAGIWAPFISKYKDEFRLYYSAPGGLEGVNLAFIGWATSSSADGPWESQGGITTSIPDDTINAIDPTVVIDQETGQHWMAYGSYQSGLYIVELDSTTGGLKTPGDRGVRIAARGGGMHAAIEGPEITYHDGYYYLFVSYDWLEDYYNVRVGRSEHPNGPYYDIFGVDMAEYSNNFPVILKPYQFNDHVGWQGTGHCSVYNDSGQYYIFNQARPRGDIYNMVLHTRKIFWIDGWPVVSPERYAAVPECDIPADSLVGEWEEMELKYVVGILLTGSTTITLDAEGTIDGDLMSAWTLQDSLLTLSWDDGNSVFKTLVAWAWDWENSVRTLVFTGMDNEGLNIWGKKINHQAVSRHTELIPGAAYSIRSRYSNLLMEVRDGEDNIGTSIRQGKDDGGLNQVWRIVQYEDGDWSLVAEHSVDNKVIEVPDGDPAATFLELGAFTGEDKQKFDIRYTDNGYFKILTKVSDYAKCFDLYGFSVLETGFISQWDDLGGTNQGWRFTRIDSLGADNSLNFESPVLTDARVYPNPFLNEIHVDLSGGLQLQRAELINSLGQVVFSSETRAETRTSLEVPAFLSGQFYLLKMYTNKGVLIKPMLKR
ncbi:MAG: family 43 glycosylhydrolase [Bacteroidales bacterium]|nr:family 43 glycosylhydrolase [Bacteroidales bacterium]